jgi:hypothetical protein
MYGVLQICIALYFAAPIMVSAFGHDGHEIVANVANSQTSAETKGLLKYILDGQSLSEVANWADDVVKERSWSAGLHFVNIVQENCNMENGCEFVYERDCPEDLCVAGAVLNYTATLRTLAAVGAEAALNSTAADEALRFVVHFVGDLHQPLHVARDSDRGGVQINVHFDVPGQGSDWSLHNVWDFGLIVRSINETFAGRQELFTAEVLRLLRTEYKSEVEGWLQCPDSGRGDSGVRAVAVRDAAELRACVVAWGQESVDAAVAEAYLNERGEEIKEGDSLSDEYYRLRLPTVQRRVAMSAVRLAAVLDGVFAY